MEQEKELGDREEVRINMIPYMKTQKPAAESIREGALNFKYHSALALLHLSSMGEASESSQ